MDRLFMKHGVGGILVRFRISKLRCENKCEDPADVYFIFYFYFASSFQHKMTSESDSENEGRL